MSISQAESLFNDKIAVRYQLYNSLFTTLPYGALSEIGGLMQLFSTDARAQLSSGVSPSEVVDQFLSKWEPERRKEILFRILQIIEREVVLFDAVEDAAFKTFHTPSDSGTVNALINRVSDEGVYEKLTDHLESYRVRIVLTAHPTQFYPDPVLGVMRELSDAIARDDLEEIRLLLLQLGRTRFRNREKPTPLIEANSVLWYLENNFYTVLPEIREKLINESGYCSTDNDLRNMLEIGFWPGGDRDGNPFVTAEITRKVAAELKESIIRKYRADLHELMKRLSFDGILEQLQEITDRIENTLAYCRNTQIQGDYYSSPDQLESDIKLILRDLHEDHQGLFAEKAEQLLGRVQLFGFHFAILDVRQDSSVHKIVCSELVHALATQGFLAQEIADQWDEAESRVPLIKQILEIEFPEDLDSVLLAVSEISQETFNSYRAVRDIRKENGPRAVHRSIISNTQGEENLFEVLFLNHISVRCYL